MSFRTMAKGKELAYMSRFFDAFGVIETRQLREAFSYLPEKKYGQIMARMQREGLCYYSEDARYISGSDMAFRHSDIGSGVMCFWALIQIKDRIRDCVAGQRPALVTVLGDVRDYDIIPVTGKNVEAVNGWCDAIPHGTVRYLVTDDLQKTAGIEWRARNDYVILVGTDGVLDTYEI